MSESWLEAYLREAVAERLATVPQPPVDTDFVPTLTAQKYGFTIPVPNELLMDMGIIPDTRKYVPPTRRERFRWWRRNQRERLGIWVYERISGETFPSADDF